jgi:putative ABC transport system permease protein
VFYVGLTPVAPKDKANAFFRQLLPEVSAIPGVQSVGGVNPVPFDYERGGHFSIARRPLDPGEIPAAAVNLVEPRYFETMRIPLLKGRTFNERDTAQGKPVAIVNEEFARMFFPTEDALGKYIQPDLGEGNRWNIWCEIVGVVRSVRNLDLTQRPRPQFYLPYEQESSTWPQAVILRVAGDPEAYVNTLRATVAGLDRELPIFETFTVDELIAKSMSSARFEAQLLTCFAVCALLLAAVGLYAALSEMVARRTFEIGLRVALGAQRGDVFQFVVRRGLVLALIGLTLGLAGFAMAVRFVAGMLYGVRSFDPLTLMGVSAILLCVSLLASAAPAWRATRLEPTAALREQ